MSIDVDAPLIVIPDTHGHLAHVEALLGNLRERGYLVDHRLAFLGDYVDRGPQIRGLLDLCITLQREGHLFLMGNHEYTLIQALTPSDVQDAWISRWARNYESRTLWSYGLRTLKSIDVQRWKHVATAFRKKIPAE
ncbi:metallophosphoesterase, partial [Candidatus Uhrbacteria bacterium]|nr:metallophosphoesterase [Candidatus Uhrbacteria bacterium]